MQWCMGKYKKRLTTYSSQNILSQQSEFAQKNVIKSDESTASGSKEWGSFEPNKSDNQSKLNQ